jgi:hypothetical protein
MYRTKRDGRNNFRFFTAECRRILQLENALHRALERDELSFHYQPSRCKTGASSVRKRCCAGSILSLAGCHQLNSFP